MNYIKFDEAMVAPITEVIVGLSIYEQSKRQQAIGYIYTLYKKDNNMVKIGFLEANYKIELITENSDWIMIETRSGSKREEKLLKSTLIELGFHPGNRGDDYVYSRKLIKYLKTLGWPIGDLLKGKDLGGHL